MTYKKDEVHLQRIEDKSIYLPYGQVYIEEYGYKTCNCLYDALKQREKGQKVVTLREADILARSKTNLNNQYINYALSCSSFFFCEGEVGLEPNAWELRAFYNRGVEFKKTKYHLADNKKKELADKTIEKILETLNNMSLPAWPEEKENGFSVELTKPEWMTFGQYSKAKRKKIQLTTPE